MSNPQTLPAHSTTPIGGSKSKFNVLVDEGGVDVIAGTVKRGSASENGAQQYGWRAFTADGEPLDGALYGSREVAVKALLHSLAAPEPDAEPDTDPEVPEAEGLEEWAREPEAEAAEPEPAEGQQPEGTLALAAEPEPAPDGLPERRPYKARLKEDLEMPGLGRSPQYVTEHASSPEEAQAQAEARGFGPFRGKFKLDTEEEQRAAAKRETLKATAPKGRGPRSARKAGGKASASLEGRHDMKDFKMDKFTLRRKYERDAEAGLYPKAVRAQLDALMTRRTNFYTPEELELINQHVVYSPQDERNVKAKDVIDSGAFRRGEKGTLDVNVWHSKQAAAKRDTIAAQLAALKKQGRK